MKTSNVKILVKTLILVLVAGLVLLTGCTATKTAKTGVTTVKDTSWMFHDIVDVKFVQQYGKFPRPKGSLIIDSRPKRPKYDKGYIPIAISIPDSKFGKMIDKLPKDKNALLIFYCGGPT